MICVALRALLFALLLRVFDIYCAAVELLQLYLLPTPIKHTLCGKTYRVYSDRDLTPQFMYYLKYGRDMTVNGFAEFLTLNYNHKPYGIVAIRGTSHIYLTGDDIIL